MERTLYQTEAKVVLSLEWRGQGAEEEGLDATSGAVLVRIDPRYHRPAEIDHLVGNAAKAQRVLGWRHTTSFEALVREMVAADREAVKRESERRNRHD